VGTKAVNGSGSLTPWTRLLCWCRVGTGTDPRGLAAAGFSSPPGSDPPGQRLQPRQEGRRKATAGSRSSFISCSRPDPSPRFSTERSTQPLRHAALGWGKHLSGGGAGRAARWRPGASLGVSVHCHMPRAGRRGFRTHTEKGCL